MERILEEQTLIEQVKSGDQAAFKSLMARYQDRVFHTCISFVPVKEDAEDLVQEVFVEVYRSVSRFKGESKLSTWIHRIAVTKALELQRYKKRQKRQAFFRNLVGLDEPAALAAGTNLHHPGIRMEDEERASVLYQAVEALPDNQRVAFSLRQIQGMSQKETAEVMGVSEKAVESYQSRAKDNLRKKLRSYYEKEMKD